MTDEKTAAPAKSCGDAEQADEAVTDDVFGWLETEVTAISCRYHGDPSYDHDAYWMRDRVVKLIGEARNLFVEAMRGEDAAKGAIGEREAFEAALYVAEQRLRKISELMAEGHDFIDKGRTVEIWADQARAALTAGKVVQAEKKS